MELLQFQKERKQGYSATKQSTFSNRANKSNKFVGVRQRPSGKWVAEIKDTYHKIRMWLGTFDTAEEAAKAYDEAACLLRGSNTRTNFVNRGPPNSPLSLKIRNLLNLKKSTKGFNFPPKSTCNTSIGAKSTKASPHHNVSSSFFSPVCNDDGLNQETRQVSNDGYKPDLSNCNSGLEVDSSASEFNHPLIAGEFLEVPKRIGLVTEKNDPREITEFELMKVERQISASIYAMSGVSQYWENAHDSIDAAFWDLPMVSQMFCQSQLVFCVPQFWRALLRVGKCKNAS